MGEGTLYIKEMRPGIFLLDEDHESTGYLVIGEDRALLIDTMNGHVNLKNEMEKLTDKPIDVINTHGHPDHVHGNIYFEEVYIHPGDLELANMFNYDPEFIKFCREKEREDPDYARTVQMRRKKTATKMDTEAQSRSAHSPEEDIEPYLSTFRFVKEGDEFDLGGRHLKIYENPGHTPGQILLLLPEERILFTGDSINHHLWAQFPDCPPMSKIVENLDRIMFLENEADLILHGHAHDFDDISLLRCMRDGAQEIVDGKTEKDEPYFYFGGEVRQHPFKCLPGKNYQQDDHVICYMPENI